jgi:hypothetical protein
MATIKADTDSVTAVWHSILGGKFRVRLTQDNGPGRRYGFVLDDNDNIIGSAQDTTYGGRGFAVHTRPFGGFVPMEQIEFVTK